MVSINPNFGPKGPDNSRGVSQTSNEQPLKPETTVKPLVIITHHQDGSATVAYDGKNDGMIVENFHEVGGHDITYYNVTLHNELRDALINMKK